MAGYGTVPAGAARGHVQPWSPAAAGGEVPLATAGGAAPPARPRSALVPLETEWSPDLAAARGQQQQHGGGGQGPAAAEVNTARPRTRGPLSVNAATAMWVKALLGVTLFSQPWAVLVAGELVVPLVLSVVAAVCLYTAQMLVTVRDAAVAAGPAGGGKHDSRGEEDEGGGLDSLPGLVEFALGPFAAVVAELAVLAACFGFLASYLAFTSAILQPLVPAHAASAVVSWVVIIVGGVLCLPREAEYAALVSGAGNVAMAVSAGGLLALFLALAAHRGWTGRTVELVAPSVDWEPQENGVAQAVPAPAAGLVACSSGFFLHFLVPSTQAAMASPQRVMEAVGRASVVATASLVAFGSLGALALGAATPRSALDVANLVGPLGAALRCAAALDVLTTIPVLCRPGLAVLQAAVERSSGQRLQPIGATLLRAAFVGAAATTLLAPGTLVPFVGGAAALVCTLVLPPLLLLLGCDIHGAGLVQTSVLERCVAAFIAAGGLGVVCLAALAVFGRLTPVPMPITGEFAPPAPQGIPEYDYAGAGLGGDYAPPLRYAFTGEPLIVPSPPPAPTAPVNWSNPAMWNHSLWVNPATGAIAPGLNASPAAAGPTAAVTAQPLPAG